MLNVTGPKKLNRVFNITQQNSRYATIKPGIGKKLKLQES